VIAIEINDLYRQQGQHGQHEEIAPRIKQAVTIVMTEAGVKSAEVSVAVVDDATIWKLNREFLEHDYPTDVLSFLLNHDGANHDGAKLEGEIIVSADTAAREAVEHDWATENELLLYVVHGALHLVGLEDSTPTQKQQMRDREKHVLAQIGIEVPPNSQTQPSMASPGART
jgi:probable rRNA maturation factor